MADPSGEGEAPRLPKSAADTDAAESTSGQDASGQGASGQGASGQGASGQSASGRDLSGQDASAQAASGHVASAEAASGQQTSGHDTSAQAASGQGSSGQDTSLEDTSLEDTSAEAALGQDTSVEAALGQDTSVEAASGQDASVEDTSGQDASGQDTWGQDTSAQAGSSADESGSARRFDPPPTVDELEDSRMPFLEHLRELRIRLRNAVAALAVGFVVAFVFSQELFVILARPLVEVWHQVGLQNPSLGKPVLYFSSLVEPFWVYLSISLWGGIFVGSPAIFHQLWMFVAPGLYRHERRYGIAFAASSAVLFIGGAVFCYHFVLPAAYSFFLDYSTHNLADLERGLGVEYSLSDAIALQPLLGMDAYLGFVKKLLLAFGLVFELPLLILFLSLAGAVTWRGLWRFNRWFIVIAFGVGAMLTPGPDVVSQILMALPMIVLYNGSIVLAYMVERRRANAERAAAERDGG